MQGSDEEDIPSGKLPKQDAADILQYLLEEGLVPERIRQATDDVVTRLRFEALVEHRDAKLAFERVSSKQQTDDFPEVERRGIIALLNLGFRDNGGLISIHGSIPDVEEPRTGSWCHMRYTKDGESRYESLRAAVLEFFEHEMDHGLYVDGEPICDPHVGEDPGAI